MALPPANASARAGWASVARFGACVILLSVALSLAAFPLGLPWWKIFRRCVSIAAVASLWFCAHRLERRPVRSYGLTATGPAARRQVLAGLGLGAACCALVVAVGFMSQVYHVDLIDDQARLWRVALTFAPIALLVGLIEELVFRGFILQHLLPTSSRIAVAASSALYSVVHVRSLAWSAAGALELVGLGLLGTVLALCYLRTGQLYLAIGLHAALAYGARMGKLVIDFPEPPLAWLFGTSRVINGAVSWAALLAVGGLIAWWRPNRSWKGGTTHA